MTASQYPGLVDAGGRNDALMALNPPALHHADRRKNTALMPRRGITHATGFGPVQPPPRPLRAPAGAGECPRSSIAATATPPGPC